MDDSDSSALSSAPPTDDEAEKAITAELNKPKGINRYFKPATKDNPPHSPPAPKRAPSPPHEYVFADNPDVAFITMFRSRFHEAFPRSLPHFGPQDIERGVSGSLPDEQMERLLCALLGLVLNRKKDVERGHFSRALEEAVSAFSSQWPAAWKGKNPLHGGGSFNNMSPEERLVLLKSLILWSLSASDAIQAIIKESYKQSRHDDDKNQPRSVQPWFLDTISKRKYYLCEGMEDTHFRLYRENSGITAKTNNWFSVAGSIEEISVVAAKFEEEKASQSKIIAGRIKAAIPRFEAGEEKRRRRDYRLARKAAFSRPEPGFSLYEGRTRGKRMRYTFSDEEDGSDSYSTRRSARGSGVSTPLEPAGPTITASGRQVKSRIGGLYGESISTDQRREIDAERAINADGEDEETSDDMPTTAGRQQRSGRVSRPARKLEERSKDGDSEGESEAGDSEKEWSGNEDEPDDSEPDFEDEDEDEEMSGAISEVEDGEDDENTQESLVVQLRYKKSGNKAEYEARPPLEKIGNTTSNMPACNGEMKTDGTPGTAAPTALPSLPLHETNGVSREPENQHEAPQLHNGNDVADVYMKQPHTASMDSVNVY